MSRQMHTCPNRTKYKAQCLNMCKYVPKYFVKTNLATYWMQPHLFQVEYHRTNSRLDANAQTQYWMQPIQPRKFEIRCSRTNLMKDATVQL